MKLDWRIILLYLLSIFYTSSFGQGNSNLRSINSRLILDSIKIDTIPIVPSSVFVFDTSGFLVPDSLYKINYIKSTIYPSATIKKNFAEFTISYRVFFQNIFNPVFHKDILLLDKTRSNLLPAYKPYLLEKPDESTDFLSESQLYKHGTIARGINMGNNQDVVINSTLNLQLSGKISEDLEILAAISDENIPIQPEGNSQNLQEFDKVFIQIFNPVFKLTAGDIELKKPYGYFMNLQKKAKGGHVEKTWVTTNKAKLNTTSASVSVMKGKYHSFSFNGKEGNQGPYKLKGAENENYIVVISGSERVYLDGVLLTRGSENQYVIDYNTAEIRFMPSALITANKRITVEFEYADRYYNRFLVFGSTRFELTGKTLFLNIYSEKDAQNQPIDQDLTNDQKKVLSSIGDSLNLAIVSGIFTDTAFSANYVYYQLLDSILPDGNVYENILRYSTKSESAKYRASFSYLGKNKGNYTIEETTLANGRVYKWIAPVNNIPQGEYEPVKLLVTPKKKQLINSGGRIKFGTSSEIAFETALSINDLNTLSSKNSNDDVGFALKTEYLKIFETSSSSKISTSLGYTLIDKYFSPPQQFREIEFNRDWNLDKIIKNSNQHLLQAKFNYSNSNLLNATVKSEYLNNSNEKAYKNTVTAAIRKNKTQANTQSSYLVSSKQNVSTRFLREKLFISRDFKLISLGAGHEIEDNRWTNTISDSLMGNSFRYQEWNIRASSLDTSHYAGQINYFFRTDWHPDIGKFEKLSNAQTVTLNSKLSVLQTQTLSNIITYRQLNRFDTTAGLQNENTLIGRVEHVYMHKKNWLNMSSIYEIGTSLEPRKEFSYLEVNPGQGQYIWIDYNNNKIKELDEFELAVFSDTAKYIRIQLPVENQIKTFSVQLAEIIHIRPYTIWSGEKGLKKIVALFSDQFTYRIDRKITNNNMLYVINPFFNIPDSQLMALNTGLRNIFSFNKISSVFSADYTFQLNENKTLLFNGFETRLNQVNGLRARYNASSLLSFFPQLESGIKRVQSDVYVNKNYKIENFLIKLSTQFLFSSIWKLTIDGQWQKKVNLNGPQKNTEKNLGAELRYSYAAKGNISAQCQFIHLTYNDKESSSIAYEMLNGLKPGNNITMRIITMYNITEILQLNMDYNFRLSNDSRPIHNGNIQLRAYF